MYHSYHQPVDSDQWERSSAWSLEKDVKSGEEGRRAEVIDIASCVPLGHPCPMAIAIIQGPVNRSSMQASVSWKE
jgi:hypothetical protein